MIEANSMEKALNCIFIHSESEGKCSEGNNYECF